MRRARAEWISTAGSPVVGTYCAITALYIDTKDVTGQAVQGKTDWVWGKVTIDPLLKNASACGSSTHRAAIVAHEQFEGTEHAQIGDRVLVIVAQDDSSTAKSAYLSMARMKTPAQGNARKANRPSPGRVRAPTPIGPNPSTPIH